MDGAIRQPKESGSTGILARDVIERERKRGREQWEGCLILYARTAEHTDPPFESRTSFVTLREAPGEKINNGCGSC